MPLVSYGTRQQGVTGCLACRPCSMPAQTRSARSKRTMHELLQAVLALGHPLGLSLTDAARCQVVCKAWQGINWQQHLMEFEFLGPDVAGRSWWQQPARLCNLTRVGLDVSTLPQVTALTALTDLLLEGDNAGSVVDLQPLSALRHLKALYVSARATGVQALSQLSKLQFFPATASDLVAVGGFQQLAWLGLGHESVEGIPSTGGVFLPADYQGVCSLPRLEQLAVTSRHLDPLDGCISLAHCSALRELRISFTWCSCCSPNEDISELTRLTQLSTLSLSAADAFALAELDLSSLPNLNVLQLDMTMPFGDVCRSGDCDWPRFNVFCLELTFSADPWTPVVVMLNEIYAAFRYWKQLGDVAFAVLDITGWPAAPATAAEESTIQELFSRFKRHGVHIESAAASRAGTPAAVLVDSFGVLPVGPAASQSGQEWSVSEDSRDYSGAYEDYYE